MNKFQLQEQQQLEVAHTKQLKAALYFKANPFAAETQLFNLDTFLKMEITEYDSKLVAEDALKYKVKLFAQDLLSQSLELHSLQSENNILKATIEEDKNELEEKREEIKVLLYEKKSRNKGDRVRLDAEAKINELQQSIVTNDTQFEQQKKELIAKYESLMRRSSAEFEENERNLLATHTREISRIWEKNEKLDQILQEKMKECEAEVSKATNKVLQKEKEMGKLREGMAAEIKSGISQKKLGANVAKKRQEDLVEKLRKEVVTLRAQPDLTDDFAKSHEQCENLKMIIKRKNMEILDLKKDEKSLVDDLTKEKDRIIITNLKLEKEKEKSKILDQNFRNAEIEHGKTRAKLKQNMNQNTVLKANVSDLHSQLRGCQPLLIKERAKTQNMANCIMRYKEDIQAVADITNPKKLIIGVARLKAKHVDGDDRVPMEENT